MNNLSNKVQVFKYVVEINSLPASGDFCHLLITFANNL